MSIMSTRLPGSWLNVFLSFCIGCGTWIGNPKEPDDSNNPKGNSDVEIEFVGSQSGANLTASGVDVIDTNGNKIGTLALSQARLVLKEIKLNIDTGDTDDRQKFEGPYIVNLINNSIYPNPGTISINDGIYQEIELDLHKLEKDDVEGVQSGDPIIDQSIHLSGTYLPIEGGANRPFSMTFELSEEFKINPSDGMGAEVSQDVINTIVVAFDLDSWFDFSGMESDLSDIESNTIVLDEKSEDPAKSVQEAIKENIKDSADFSKKED
ncbi:MAG: hypothetical protein R3B45_05780 [Bdellovibrionota bacterium]